MPQNNIITGDLPGTLANMEAKLAFLCQAAEDPALCHPGLALALHQLHGAARWAGQKTVDEPTEAG